MCVQTSGGREKKTSLRFRRKVEMDLGIVNGVCLVMKRKKETLFFSVCNEDLSSTSIHTHFTRVPTYGSDKKLTTFKGEKTTTILPPT